MQGGCRSVGAGVSSSVFPAMRSTPHLPPAHHAIFFLALSQIYFLGFFLSPSQSAPPITPLSVHLSTSSSTSSSIFLSCTYLSTPFRTSLGTSSSSTPSRTSSRTSSSARSGHGTLLFEVEHFLSLNILGILTVLLGGVAILGCKRGQMGRAVPEARGSRTAKIQC